MKTTTASFALVLSLGAAGAMAQHAGHAAHAGPAPADAAATRAGAVEVVQPRARATAPGQPAGGGYLTLRNTGRTADRLLSAKAEVSASVELHTMRMEGDVMRMRQVEAIELPAGATVELKPGGDHLMFIGLKAPLQAGQRFPVTLRFEKAGDVKVDVAVEPAANAAPAHKH